MEKVKVYHYSKCQTCRKAIASLEGKVEMEMRDIFKERLSKEEIASLLKMAGVSAKDALRKKDKMYKELELDSKEYSEDELIEFMSKYPGLIARPIIVKGSKAFIREFDKILR